MKKNNSLVLVIVVAVLVGALIVFMPSIYKWSSSLSIPKVKDVKTEEVKKEQKQFDESVLEGLVYPNMHVNSYTKDTYYSLNKFTIANMSNNDILANALEQVYEGYIVNGPTAGCSTTGKKVNASYLNARIKNIFSTGLKYQFIDFNVYNTKYPGVWKYDAASKSYIYNGNCNNNGNTKYYDIHKMVKYDLADNNKTIYITAKVAFVKIENGNYIIYKDTNMTQELDKGTFQSLDALNNRLSNLSARQYKYTFKQGLCSYETYCLEKGEWLNG